ncbi:FecCD family ABC transporter permease [Euzebya rosea]|uniref:FecCD family ABC transporter permease n=1 Tax=Euzebya rosea TaxID=2052804 RepID=UPI000D3E2078|nr:iron chelate uptake ABC transporter family permease subunit [Euzebya rosea]
MTPVLDAATLEDRSRVAVRVGSLSWRVERRVVAATLALVAALVGLFTLSMVLGDYPVPPSAIPAAVLGRGPEELQFVVHTLRLPRALVGIMVGAAFGLSGAVLQRVTGNVLASPDIIGITAGASAAAVALIVLGTASVLLVTLGALIGGISMAVLVYVLSWRDGLSGYRMVLIGIGLSSAATAVVQYLLTRADLSDASQAMVWLTGSLNGRSWAHVGPVAVALAVVVPPTLLGARALRALQLGDDAARQLGTRVEWSRALLVLASVLLAAVAVAAAGPVAFVALAAPPIAARLSRTGGVALVPAMAAGACMLLSADLVAQHLMGGLPVGVATALVGAPYLLYLLGRSHRIGASR